MTSHGGPLDEKRVLARIGAGTLGGWLFVFGQTALGTAVATRALGVPYDDALSLFVLLAFPVLLAAFFGHSSVARRPRSGSSLPAAARS